MKDEIARQLLFSMKRIRMVEEAIAGRYPEGRMRCPTHLSIGQEAVAAVAGMLISDGDLVVSSHRAHAHYLGVGGDLNAMIAELHGKVTGCSRGKGGSMHLVDRKIGFAGSTAIVANTIPVGAGIALAMKIRELSGVCCIFLGDGAVEEGVFYESINFVALHNLPVVFLCENNFYSVYSPLSVRQPAGRKIHKMVQAIGVRGVYNSGIDIESLYTTLTSAFSDTRSTKQPVFVEVETYRWREHCGPDYDDELGYRSEQEIRYWKENDILNKFEDSLKKKNILNQKMILSMEEKINKEIAGAFQFAEESPFPEREELAKDIYSTENRGFIPWCDN